ncbi:MAG: histidine--tRNA ligase [Rhodobiaceae bacterium]|nr:histidine--tRNA ligase [Rhodobiaceae bacterium]
MGKDKKPARVAARLPRGFIDRAAGDLAAQRAMLESIEAVYERYGFDPLETPAIEYTEALGKFLPDEDRPNEGVFSFQDDDEQWLSLRYDLTAPLARYVAQNYDQLAKPFRSYRAGYVFRNEKPGPGRFRQFMQFDADTVGTESMVADAEICMMAADCMEELGIARGDYVVRVSSRKVLDALLETVGLGGEDQTARRLTALRAIDKLDRLGPEGVRALLGKGRRDDSGDFTRGAELEDTQIDAIMRFVGASDAFSYKPLKEAGAAEIADGELSADGTRVFANALQLEGLGQLLATSPSGREALDELGELASLVAACGYGTKRIRIDPSVVRGLEYYTGPVYEVELTFETVNEKGEKARFGSVAGGGRYDGLVARFRGQEVPATGMSIGVSRLQAALAALGRQKASAPDGPVVVLVMDREYIADYLAMAASLRSAGIRAEIYVGTSGMRAQMKYADRRAAPLVVIQGEDERAGGQVTVKDLDEGLRLSRDIEDRESWTAARPAQVAVPQENLVACVKDMLAARLAAAAGEQAGEGR